MFGVSSHVSQYSDGACLVKVLRHLLTETRLAQTEGPPDHYLAGSTSSVPQVLSTGEGSGGGTCAVKGAHSTRRPQSQVDAKITWYIIQMTVVLYRAREKHGACAEGCRKHANTRQL